MAYEAFRDYLEISRSAQMHVWVVLYETPDASSPGRWLRIDVRRLAEVGSRGERRGAGGGLVAAWVWPVQEMEVVAGPEVAVPGDEVPLLPNEGGDPSLQPADLEPIEKALRRRREAADIERDVPEESNRDAAEHGHSREDTLVGTSRPDGPAHWLDSDSALALDVLRRALGVPHMPRYSVLRVGLDGIDVDDLLGLMQYGIRVFVVSSDPPSSSLSEMEREAFEASRMLEWSVVPEARGRSLWVVDGRWPEGLDDGMRAALSAADDAGGINFAQYDVVHADPDLDVMVKAGAGTGKTETMAERIVYLLATSGVHALAEGSSPTDLRADEVALVTFTRESAAEMRQRIARTLLLRQRLCRRCALPVVAWMLQLAAADIVTIHSLAKRIAASSAGAIGLGPEFRVATRTMEIRDLTHRALSARLADLIDSYPGQMPPAHEWVRHVQAVWDALENNGVDLLRLGDAGSSPDLDWGEAPGNGLAKDVVETTHAVIEAVAREVRDLCLEDQFLPTNQLVPAATRALGSSSGSVVRRYRYLFVDEFQDTDASQMELILELRERLGCRLLVVGDAKQGIYRFRGAEGNAFEEMSRRVDARGLPEMRVFPLTRNFRSGRTLLDSLHPYFARWGSVGLLPYEASDRLRARSDVDDHSSAVVVEQVGRSDVVEEAASRVDRWRTLHPGSSVGVLCRQNWQAVKVQQAVRRLDLPCELRVGGSFYQSPAVRELRVLLEAVADPLDDAALLELCETRWAAAMLYGEPPADVPVAAWGEAADAPATWATRVATAARDGDFLREDLAPLRQRLGSLHMMLSSMPTLGWLVECIRTFQPEACEVIAEDDETERRRYGRCLDHLITLIDLQFGDGPTTLERVLAWLRLQIATNHFEDEPQADTDGKIVALTVHKAKGLEFDHVLVPFTDNQFGPPRTLPTRTSVLRPTDGRPRLLWRWTLNRGRQYATDFSNVPLNRSQDWQVDDADTAKEETRLLYVAMTRARDELALFVDPRTRLTSSPMSWAQLVRMED
jgi:superfamily I DNA/RNA helicase